jgi:hypothetical protein
MPSIQEQIYRHFSENELKRLRTSGEGDKPEGHGGGHSTLQAITLFI